MNEPELPHQIESAKSSLSEISEALENFSIDEYLHESFRNLDERVRTLEIKFQALINSRKH